MHHSNGNTVQGAVLKTSCDNVALQQMLRESTRNQYLLDLYLTDVPGTKMTVGPSIADHCFLLASVPLPEITTLHMTRQRFNIARADWPSLKAALVSVDWSPLQRVVQTMPLLFSWNYYGRLSALIFRTKTV